MPANNTPPRSPYIGEEDRTGDPDDDDDLIYVGTTDDLDNIFGPNESDSDGEPINEGIREEDDGSNESVTAPERDDASITFRQHVKPVFCGTIHPAGELAVTGGEDDLAYVWKIESGEVVHTVTGHNDTVIAAEFSNDGNYLATGDMAGEIQVYKTFDWRKVWEFSMGDMSWMKWHRAANVLLAGGDSGESYVWRIPSGECKVLQGNGHKAECGQLTVDGKKLIVGHSNGAVRLWDIKTTTIIQEINSDSPFGHSGQVNCICCDPQNGSFLTGCEDGKILIAGTSGPLGNLQPNSGSIEGLAFCNDEEFKLVACGTLQGSITIWDIPRQSIRLACENNDGVGVVRLFWIHGTTVLCGMLDGSVRGFDGRSGQQNMNLLGHSASVYDMHYNKEKNILLTTSEDHTAKIFTLLP